jgi:hypothetical protein
MKRITVLFEDEALYAAVKAEAARRNCSLNAVVTEALQEWLEAQEDAELLPLIDAAQAEWEEKGGVEAGEFFRRLKAEQTDSRAV